MSGDGSVASPTGLYVGEDYYPGLETSATPPTLRLLSPRVIGFNCLFLASDGITWSNIWDSTTQTTLPVAVRIELTILSRTPGAIPVVFATTANLLTATAPTTTSTTTGGSNATP